MAESRVAKIHKHVRSHLISGMFILVPVVITVLVLQICFNAMASGVRPFVEQALKLIAPDAEHNEFLIVTISVLIFVILVYLVGLISAYFFGKRMLSFVESVILRVPVVKSIYSTAKQVINTLSMSKQDTYTGVVMVDFPREGMKSVAFVTGSYHDTDGREMYKLFIPTSPNPTSGFLVIVPAHSVTKSDMTVEEAVRTIVSAGVMSPDRM